MPTVLRIIESADRRVRRFEEASGMIRCAWCGANNYAIDSWCASCSRHLDWSPPPTTAVMPPPPPIVAASAEPRRPPRRRRLIVLAPAAIVVAVAILLALPVATWFSAAVRARPALPNTALRPAAPAATATTAPAQSVATPDVTPAPEATPAPAENSTQGGEPVGEAAPTPQASPAQTPPDEVPPAGADPAASVALFYQAVSSHDFTAAAALWTSRMQAQFPPAQFIDHRFAATQQINLQAERTLVSRDGVAIVYVRVIEVIGGQSRRWVGTWQLLNTGSEWLLNRPNLRADS
jgi:hypothetical protein